MSYRNFVPDVYGVQIMQALKQETILMSDCYNVYKGQIMQAGDTVTFEDVGDPTVYEINFENRNADIPEPEMLEDERLTMKIRQIRVVNFCVGDIDAKIAAGNIKGMMGEKVPRVMGLSIDKYIANMVTRGDLPNAFEADGGTVTVGKGQKNPLYVIDEITQKLYENNVPETDEITLYATPTYYRLCKQEFGTMDTDNSDILRMGKIGRYNDVILKRTNTIVHDPHLNADMMLIKTRDCIGYAGAMRKIEAYCPESKFDDAVKGMYFFDAKVINPRKGFLMPVKYAV